MKNKSINLVAALTLGILAISAGSVNATTLQENQFDEIEIIGVKDGLSYVNTEFTDNVLNISCPVQSLAKPVSPRVKTTNDDCGCKKDEAVPPPCPCDEPKPCDVSPACPVVVEEPAPCDPCEEVKPCEEPKPCEVSPACPVTPCDNNCGPACTNSPSLDKNSLERIQIYAYPRSLNLFGNNLTGNQDNFNNGSYSNTYTGTVVSDAGCGCEKTMKIFNDRVSNQIFGHSITGAAAGIPVQNNPCIGMSGVPVDNSADAHEHHGCPITIHTSSSVQIPTLTYEKLDVQQVTGAAVPLINTFDDVPNGYWAAYDINRLAASKVISGYPDQTFRPDRKVTRAEFAALAVSGLNYQGAKYYNKAIFSDVPQHHWANSVIDKGVNAGLIAGYPDGKFKPKNLVTRTEALVILSKALPSCDMDDCKANEILSKYADYSAIPDWAKVPVAKALQANALKKSPDCNSLIRGNDYATRAEIAGMLANIRIAMGIDAAEIACGCTETGAAAYVEVEQMKQYPTLKVKFDDQITAKDSQAGDGFRAYTTECVTIDGIKYPEGSIVRGKIVEAIRPSHNCKGGLKIVFTEIEHDGNKSALPEEVLSAQVLNTKNPNIVSKILKMPFTLTGALVGNTARAVGTVISQAGNGLEAVTNDFGTGTGELFQGKFKASMRSYGQSGLEMLKTPVQMTASAISGVAGVAEVSVDEVAYVVSSNGARISQISPNEIVQIAFGTCPKAACK